MNINIHHQKIDSSKPAKLAGFERGNLNNHEQCLHYSVSQFIAGQITIGIELNEFYEESSIKHTIPRRVI